MPLSEREVKKIVTSKKGGEIWEVYGPIAFGGSRVWEVWAFDQGSKEYQTRYVIDDGTAEPQYFETFLMLMMHLNDLYSAAVREGGAIDWTRTKEMADLQLKRISLYVASFVFTGSVAACIYLLLTRPESPAILFIAVTGIVSSGVALFFGKWVPIGSIKPEKLMDSVVARPESGPRRNSRPLKGSKPTEI